MRSKKCLIAAHRGSCGGNIPPNTIESFRSAIFQGADILEVDIARSTDGVFYTFHTGFEKQLANLDCSLENLTSSEIDKINLLNEFSKTSGHHIPKLTDVFEALSEFNIVYNLDRSWLYWDEIIPLIDHVNLAEKIILKSPCRKELFEKLKEINRPDIAYMPIINEDIDEFYNLGGASIPGFCGAEITFSSENAPVIKNKVIEKLHKENKIVWGNGIQFAEDRILSAGHNDDVSITGNPEYGWGWLLDNGFDIIQTDWVSALNRFITSRYNLI